MTLARKVTLFIIVCIACTGVAQCLIHWVTERRAAHRALEDEARWLARITDGQIALLQAQNDPRRMQTFVNFACRWRREIVEFAYYSSAPEDQGAGQLRLVASLQPSTTSAEPPPLANEALKLNRLILKRRYHEQEPHVAAYSPVHDKKQPHGVVVIRLSPTLSMTRVWKDEQNLMNAWLLLGPIAIVVLVIAIRFLIVGRVAALTQATQRGGREEIERLGHSRASDEFGRLAQQINQMLRSVLSKNIVWERLYSASVQEENNRRGDAHAEAEDEAALAVRDRLERELEIANRIQRSLLPETFPADHGLRFAVRYAPAGQVGGDLYDFVVVDQDMLGIMIADVAGHGIPAAFVAGMTKIAFTQFAFQNPSPSAVVTSINEYLYTHLRTGHYVTIFYGIYNRATKAFRFVRAGHQTPFVLRKDSGVIEPLETGGPLVGAESKMKFDESEIALRPGDKILMFTDGLAECRNEQGARVGQAGLRKMLDGLAGKSVEAVAADIFRKSADFRGAAPPDDDITILIAEVQNGA